VVSRLVRGRWCHEAQFVLDGRAPLRHLVGTESVVAIDLGPSLLHVVYDSESRHIEIAPSVENVDQKLRRLKRKLDRQHREASPECFDEEGRHIKGTCYWRNRSKKAKETEARIAECYRLMAARRDSDHGQVANELVAISPNFRMEDHGVILPDGTQQLDLDATRRELFGEPDLASDKREQEGVPALIPLLRQDLGARPEETPSEKEKQRVRRYRPPGRRSLVRIRRRFEAKAKKRSDRAARPEDGAIQVVYESSPTAKAA
jgi:hypothetical protein